MMLPPLAIIIPSFSRVDLLEACLRSVVQYAPEHTEILVIDDASPNSSVSGVSLLFPGVRVLRLNARRGFAHAANLGIAHTRAPIVELLNDDTEVKPGWADAALKWFDDPRIGAVAPLVLQHADVLRIDSAGDVYDRGGFARKRGNGKLFSDAPRKWNQPGEVWGVNATAGFYRRAALERAGGFPEDFVAYFEDVDLSFRIRNAGFTIWYEPNSQVLHHISASYGKKPERSILVRQSCNEERLFWRNTRGWHRYRWLPRHACVLLGKACLRWKQGTLAPWLQGRVQAWLGAA